MKVLVVSGSIRSRKAHADYVFRRAGELDELEEYISDIKAYLSAGNSFSNSDILAGASLLAARKLGAEIDFFPLMKLFPRKEKKVAYTADKVLEAEIALTDTLALSEHQFDELRERVLSADGVIVASPVYFGDRSSVANKLLQLSGIHNLLEEKAFGAAAVGAKRNGGQETTVIYSLIEALNQNALVVGNGPPTSQYGGTAVGGKKGAVIEDSWGLETAFGTGTRVAHVGEILKKGRAGALDRPVRIKALVTMDDTKQILQSYLEDIAKKVQEQLPNVEFKIENILNSTIYRCLGCDTCPCEGKLPLGERPTKENHAKCIIRNPEDAMEQIHNLLLEADGILIAGLNVKQHDELIYRYQALTERTRYIRRDNFELTNKLITALSLNQVGARINSLHALKTVTSYIRHNAIIHKPIEAFVYEGKILDDGMKDLIHFVRFAEMIALGREMVDPLLTEYTTKGIGGY